MTDDEPGAGDPPLDAIELRTAVRERYGDIAADAAGSASCCGDTGLGCESPADRSRDLGYPDADVDAVGPGANLGLGCGNPTAIASLDEGETVLDLGAGGGFDCFLAAREVGPDGRVIGVDMTPEMIERARRHAERTDAANVEFRLGEIEHLPVPDESVDVIVSNCVVNLSPDKPRVVREAYRVLRPGGRLAVSDVVSTAEIPANQRADPESVASCVAGASSIPALEATLTGAGFTGVSVEPTADGGEVVRGWDDERDPSDYVVPATIEATKPARGARP